MRIVAVSLIATAAVAVATGSNVAGHAPADAAVFISEIHYDNAGNDAGEAIEVFGPAGTDLSGWSIVLYNGAGGAVYDTDALSGLIPDEGGGYGTVFLSYPSNGIQNGSPDGIALVNGTTVIQFLSYEGPFTAVGGSANGVLSTDIGVSETGSEAVGGSLALAGTGALYGELAWTTQAAHSFGTLGPITTTEPPIPPLRISELHYDNTDADAGEAVEVTGPAGVDLAGWSIVLHNGSGGAVYDTIALSGMLPDEDSGLGAAAFAHAGIQNGAPDGIALVEPRGRLVEFLSYEGSFAGVGGAADGVTSIDIGVAESEGTPAGRSLQLLDGAWTGPVASSFGLVNFVPRNCPLAVEVTPIHVVQGDGADTPCPGEDVTIEGVVVADFEGPPPTLRGFYVQEEDVDADSDLATSEGIFVFNGSEDDVSVGDLVSVTGDAVEFQGQTQINFPDALAVVSSGIPLPATSSVTMPFTAARPTGGRRGHAGHVPGDAVRHRVLPARPLRRSARVERPPAATADRQRGAWCTGAGDAGGQRPEPADHRRHTEQPERRPDRVRRQRHAAHRRQPVARRRHDDRRNGRHDIHVGGQQCVRQRLSPAPGDGADRVPDRQPAAESAPDVGGSLTIASFNVLNYFLTLDEPGNDCGPAGNKVECRGAETAAEYERQHDKLIAALDKLDADVLGLIELENSEGVEPLAAIVDGLNAVNDPDTYAYVNTGNIGTDTIKVGIIFKPASVRPLGAHAIIDSSVDPRFVDTRNRPSLAQSFAERSTGEVVTLVVNHLKSKGCGGETGGDIDSGDGQGCFNATRTAAAEALVDWMATHPTGIDDDDVLVMGDLNSYAKEDPITVLANAGFVDLASMQDDSYSFVFDGQWGYLDYALASPSLASQVTGAAEYHINADEVPVLDYNSNFKSPAQIASLFAADEFRTSDHDPVVVGFDLNGLVVDEAVIVARPRGGGTLALSAHVESASQSCPRVQLAVEGVEVVNTATTRFGGTCIAITSRGVVTFGLDNGRIGAVLTLPTAFRLPADNVVTFAVSLDGFAQVADQPGRRIGPIWTAT